jgi:hypothetical protein
VRTFGPPLALVLVASWAFVAPSPARAGDAPSPVPAAIPADCTILGTADAAAILGYAVQAPDPASQSAGVCFFTSREVAPDGNLSYAVITAAQLPQRRAFFRAYSRRCAPAAKGTLNELACRQFLKLAVAQTIDDYYAARAGAGEPSPVPGLGDSAAANGDALYVKRGQTVLEISVKRGGDFDLVAATKVAKELLARLKA